MAGSKYRWSQGNIFTIMSQESLQLSWEHPRRKRNTTFTKNEVRAYIRVVINPILHFWTIRQETLEDIDGTIYQKENQNNLAF